MPNNQIIMAKSSKCIEARHLRNERRKDRKEKSETKRDSRTFIFVAASSSSYANSLRPNCCSFIRTRMSQSRAHHHRQRVVCRWPWCSRCVYWSESKTDEGKFERNKFPIGVAAFTFSVKTEWRKSNRHYRFMSEFSFSDQPSSFWIDHETHRHKLCA